ncbi:MAG: ABC transporter permease subunit [Gemmatimonadota bacterium]|nr:MAG: ABC transporter permease subunit [Gemmatimonadota bacterium]
MATSAQLQLHAGSGGLVGLGNMVSKEWNSWWRTRRGLTHLILWLIVINGLMFLVGVDERQGSPPQEVLDELIEVFIRAGGLFATIGIVLATQSAVVSERQLGTAEWVLSKPVSRHAFLLSKLLVNGTSFVFLAVVVPTVVFYLQVIHHALMQPTVVPFLMGLLLHVEHLVFYLTLTVLLGTYFRSRGAVSGVAIGFLIAGSILPGVVPSVTALLPWALHPIAGTIARTSTVPDGAHVTILMCGLWSILWILLALWRFGREEF